MAKYIDKQAAIEQIKAEWAKLPLSETTGFGILMRVLTSIPAADVRPVVLCRDCIHFKPQQKSARWANATPMCSRSATIKMPPDGFCSFGVKREES